MLVNNANTPQPTPTTSHTKQEASPPEEHTLAHFVVDAGPKRVFKTAKQRYIDKPSEELKHQVKEKVDAAMGMIYDCCGGNRKKERQEEARTPILEECDDQQTQ